MAEEFIKVKVVSSMVEAELIKTRLDSAEIPCVLKYEAIGQIMNITLNGLGQVAILVPEELEEDALSIIGS